MDLGRLSRSEAIASCGGLLLAISVFLGWYHAKSSLTMLAGKSGPVTESAWQVHPVLRFLLLLAAVAPIILSYIVARGHALSWPRGEMTAITAIAAFGLVAYNAFVSKPGDPRSEISLKYGVFIALVASVLMLVGAAQRSGEVERKRRPPGTL
jgi:hypothetical protein